MFLHRLSIINFKNYLQKEVIFSPKINCFVGDNGVGKTNLLDAIYYLSFCKSCFNAIDSQNINYKMDFFVIQGEFLNESIVENIYCGVKKNHKKVFKRNDKDYLKLSDHIGRIPLVMISPLDNTLIGGNSEERRKFINNVIVQFDKEYLDDVIKYNKALQNRNKLLKDSSKSGSFNQELIDVWDEQIIPVGERIYERRKSFIEKFKPVFLKYYEFVSLKNERIDIKFESSLHQGNFRELLKNSLEKDKILQYTSSGPHKDDLVFTLEGFPIKKAGSQGQQKTFLVALKLAQFEFINQISNCKPILLLDDIFDKLDKNRVKQIVSMVAEDNFGQIFITDTNPERLEEILKNIPIEYQLFNIEKE